MLRRLVSSQAPRVAKILPPAARGYLKTTFPAIAGFAHRGGLWQRKAPDETWQLTVDWMYVFPDAIVIKGHYLCVDEASNHSIFIDGEQVTHRSQRADVLSLLGTDFPHNAKNSGFWHILANNDQARIQLEVRSASGEIISMDSLMVWSAGSPGDRNAQYEWYYPLAEELDDRAVTPIDESIKFSIVVPVYNVGIEYLQQCVASVLQQSYSNWELCICDDKSTRADTLGYLQTLEGSDPRIKVLFSEVNQNISGASNSAVSMATGDYVGLLDHDDALHQHALHHVASAILDDTDIDIIYSDEDKLDLSGHRVGPYYKPQYSRELLLSNNYITHFLVIKRSLGDEVGWFRLGYEGSQDHDLVLRLVEKATKIHHIPKILYHWRMVEGSTALAGDEKPYAWDAGVRAVGDALERRGISGSVDYGNWRGAYSVTYDLTETPKISIVIPFRDHIDLLRTALTSIFDKTEYKNFEILLVDNGSELDETHEYLALYENVPQVKIVPFDEPFNYSRINNYAIGQATGEIILLLNNDVQVITQGWLTTMYRYLQQESVGGVGAHLLYDDDTNQHNGIVLGIGGVAGHAFKGLKSEDYHYFSDGLSRNVSACTAACLMVSREDWAAVGGLNEEDLRVAFNDIDFCLKIGALGKEIIFPIDVELYHFESKSRGYENTPEKLARFKTEFDYMRKNWSEQLDDDPYYNPNLTRTVQDFSLDVEGVLSRYFAD